MGALTEELEIINMIVVKGRFFTSQHSTTMVENLF